VSDGGKTILKDLDGALTDDAEKGLAEALNNGSLEQDLVESSSNEIKDLASNAKKKLTWEEVRAYFKRGNDFNDKGRLKYKYNEINLVDGKRLDSYIPGKEIVSRKATTLSGIKPQTFEGYLKELVAKYEKGKAINSPKYGNDFKNDVLKGDYFLEIPTSNKMFFESNNKLKELAGKYNVSIKYLEE